jgi:hypothetical protein
MHEHGHLRAQVLVLLAGYTRGRCARLQRDWTAACSCLAEGSEAVEVICLSDLHSPFCQALITFFAVAEAVTSRFSASLPLALEGTAPLPPANALLQYFIR